MNRLGFGNQPGDSDEPPARLHRAGGSIGDFAFAVVAGGLVGIVRGTLPPSLDDERDRRRYAVTAALGGQLLARVEYPRSSGYSSYRQQI